MSLCFQVTDQVAFDEDDDEEQRKLVDNIFGFLDGATTPEKSALSMEVKIWIGFLKKLDD